MIFRTARLWRAHERPVFTNQALSIRSLTMLRFATKTPTGKKTTTTKGRRARVRAF